VQIDRHVQRLRSFEDRPELLIVKVFAACMGVDDGSLQAERPNPAFEFLSGGGRILRCYGCKARETVRILPNRRHHEVIAGSREGHRQRSIEDLHAR
jgi:hypothetical protein